MKMVVELEGGPPWGFRVARRGSDENVFISQVIKLGKACKVGLKVGDVVERICAKQHDNSDIGSGNASDFEEVTFLLSARPPQANIDSLSMEIVRTEASNAKSKITEPATVKDRYSSSFLQILSNKTKPQISPSLSNSIIKDDPQVEKVNDVKQITSPKAPYAGGFSGSAKDKRHFFEKIVAQKTANGILQPIFSRIPQRINLAKCATAPLVTHKMDDQKYNQKLAQKVEDFQTEKSKISSQNSACNNSDHHHQTDFLLNCLEDEIPYSKKQNKQHESQHRQQQNRSFLQQHEGQIQQKHRQTLENQQIQQNQRQQCSQKSTLPIIAKINNFPEQEEKEQNQKIIVDNHCISHGKTFPQIVSKNLSPTNITVATNATVSNDNAMTDDGESSAGGYDSAVPELGIEDELRNTYATVGSEINHNKCEETVFDCCSFVKKSPSQYSIVIVELPNMCFVSRTIITKRKLNEKLLRDNLKNNCYSKISTTNNTTLNNEFSEDAKVSVTNKIELDEIFENVDANDVKEAKVEEINEDKKCLEINYTFLNTELISEKSKEESVTNNWTKNVGNSIGCYVNHHITACNSSKNNSNKNDNSIANITNDIDKPNFTYGQKSSKITENTKADIKDSLDNNFDHNNKTVSAMRVTVPSHEIEHIDKNENTNDTINKSTKSESEHINNIANEKNTSFFDGEEAEYWARKWLYENGINIEKAMKGKTNSTKWTNYDHFENTDNFRSEMRAADATENSQPPNVAALRAQIAEKLDMKIPGGSAINSKPKIIVSAKPKVVKKQTVATSLNKKQPKTIGKFGNRKFNTKEVNLFNANHHHNEQSIKNVEENSSVIKVKNDNQINMDKGNDKREIIEEEKKVEHTMKKDVHEQALNPQNEKAAEKTQAQKAHLVLDTDLTTNDDLTQITTTMQQSTTPIAADITRTASTTVTTATAAVTTAATTNRHQLAYITRHSSPSPPLSPLPVKEDLQSKKGKHCLTDYTTEKSNGYLQSEQSKILKHSENLTVSEHDLNNGPTVIDSSTLPSSSSASEKNDDAEDTSISSSNSYLISPTALKEFEKNGISIWNRIGDSPNVTRNCRTKKWVMEDKCLAPITVNSHVMKNTNLKPENKLPSLKPRQQQQQEYLQNEQKQQQQATQLDQNQQQLEQQQQQRTQWYRQMYKKMNGRTINSDAVHNYHQNDNSEWNAPRQQKQSINYDTTEGRIMQQHRPTTPNWRFTDNCHSTASSNWPSPTLNLHRSKSHRQMRNRPNYYHQPQIKSQINEMQFKKYDPIADMELIDRWDQLQNNQMHYAKNNNFKYANDGVSDDLKLGVEKLIERQKVEKLCEELQDHLSRRHGYIPNSGPSLERKVERLDALLNEFSQDAAALPSSSATVYAVSPLSSTSVQPRSQPPVQLANLPYSRSRSYGSRYAANSLANVSRRGASQIVTCTALFDFVPQNSREIGFRHGDVLRVHRQLDANWLEGERDGRLGVFPLNHVQMRDYAKSSSRYKAMHKFYALNSNELSLSPGAVLEKIRDVDQNWIEGRNSKGKVGIFPKNCVVEIDQTDFEFEFGEMEKEVFSRQNGATCDYPSALQNSHTTFGTTPDRPKTPKMVAHTGSEAMTPTIVNAFELENRSTPSKIHTHLNNHYRPNLINYCRSRSAGSLRCKRQNEAPAVTYNMTPTTGAQYPEAWNQEANQTRLPRSAQAASAIGSYIHDRLALTKTVGQCGAEALLLTTPSINAKEILPTDSLISKILAERPLSPPARTISPPSQYNYTKQHSSTGEKRERRGRSMTTMERQAEMVAQKTESSRQTRPANENPLAETYSPKRFLPPHNAEKYRALYAYKPQHEDELELMEGDVVHVVRKCDDGWFIGTLERTGQFGTFPGNYIVNETF